MSPLPASTTPDKLPARSPAPAPLLHTLRNASSEIPAQCWPSSRSNSCPRQAPPPPPPLPPHTPASKATPASPDTARRETSPPRDSTQSPSPSAKPRPCPARESVRPQSSVLPARPKCESARSLQSDSPCQFPPLLCFLSLQ